MKTQTEIENAVIEQSNITDINRIKDVLRRYFECDDSGNPNKHFDDCYTAQAAIDDIHEIIGEI